MSSRSLWLTRANGLTLLRLLVAPALAVAVLGGAAGAASVLFWLAVATDVADGRVARRYGQASPRGRLLDHAADATFVTVGTAALARSGALPAFLPLAIAVAFLQYALETRLSGGSGLRPSRLGHWNGIAYYVAVAAPIMRDSLGLAWPGASTVRDFGWLLVASTVLSVAQRLGSSPRAEQLAVCPPEEQ